MLAIVMLFFLWTHMNIMFFPKLMISTFFKIFLCFNKLKEIYFFLLAVSCTNKVHMTKLTFKNL